jgi:hypothetical protein
MLSSLTVDDLYDKVSWLHGARDFVEGETVEQVAPADHERAG